MLRITLRAAHTLAFVVAASSLPTALSGQSANAPPKGLFLSGALAIGRPVFSERTEQVLAGAGSTGSTREAVFGLGFSARRFGAELVVDAGSATINGSQAGTLSLAALMHVHISGMFGSWRPQATVGYVRHGVNDVTVPVAELPPELQSFYPNATTVDGLGIIGNGARVGMGLYRPVTQRVSITINGSVDAIRYGSVTSDGSEISLRNAGWTYLPRVTVSARFYPSR